MSTEKAVMASSNWTTRPRAPKRLESSHLSGIKFDCVEDCVEIIGDVGKGLGGREIVGVGKDLLAMILKSNLILLSDQSSNMMLNK